MKCDSCVYNPEADYNNKHRPVYCEARDKFYERTFLARTLCSDYFMGGR